MHFIKFKTFMAISINKTVFPVNRTVVNSYTKFGYQLWGPPSVEMFVQWATKERADTSTEDGFHS